MEELKQYLNDHKLFRLTPEMIEKIMVMVDNIENNAFENGSLTTDRDAW